MNGCHYLTKINNLFFVSLQTLIKILEEILQFLEYNVLNLKITEASNKQDKLFQEHFNLIAFRFFNIINNKVCPNFFHINQISERYDQFIDVIKFAIFQFENISQNNNAMNNLMSVNSQEEFYTEIFEHTSEALFKCSYFKKLFSIITDQLIIKKQKINTIVICQLLKLFIYGIVFPINNQNLLLHQAIFENKLQNLHDLLTNLHQQRIFFIGIDDPDQLGMSPLNLAVKLQKTDLVECLLQNGADPNLHTVPHSYSPLQYALKLKNVEILTQMLQSNFSQNIFKFEHLIKEQIYQIMKSVIDFSCEMKLDCHSKFIPFIQKLTPNDTYKIYKKGSSIRIDFTLIGFEKLKVLRGNRSLLFKDQGTHQGKLIIVNHDQKTIIDLFNNQSYNDHLETALEMIKYGKHDPDLQEENLLFKKSTNQADCILVNDFQCEKYEMKAKIDIAYHKKWDFLNFKIDNKTNITYSQANDICNQNKLFILDENNEDLLAQFIEAAKNVDQQLINNKVQNKIDSKQKNVSALMWITKQTPIKIVHLKCLLEILAQVSRNLDKFKQLLYNSVSSLNEFDYLPIKTVIPVGYTISAMIQFQNFKFENNMSNSLFDINEQEYKAIGQLNIIQRNIEFQKKLMSQKYFFGYLYQNQFKIMKGFINNLEKLEFKKKLLSLNEEKEDKQQQEELEEFTREQQINYQENKYKMNLNSFVLKHKSIINETEQCCKQLKNQQVNNGINKEFYSNLIKKVKNHNQIENQNKLRSNIFIKQGTNQGNLYTIDLGYKKTNHKNIKIINKQNLQSFGNININLKQQSLLFPEEQKRVYQNATILNNVPPKLKLSTASRQKFDFSYLISQKKKQFTLTENKTKHLSQQKLPKLPCYTYKEQEDIMPMNQTQTEKRNKDYYDTSQQIMKSKNIRILKRANKNSFSSLQCNNLNSIQ